jgi:dihydrolipoamide dehydrogenase
LSAQLASFGWTEQQAAAASMDFDVSTFPLTANGKAHGLGDAHGFVKVLSSRPYGELLGAHMIGPDVTELLPELTLAQRWDVTIHEVARNIHVHPTLSETVKEAVYCLTGDQINL